MYLKLIKEDAYNNLFSNIHGNNDLYLQPQSWINDYFKGSDYFGESSVRVNNVQLLYNAKTDEQKSIEDLENVRLIYNAFKTLTPYQATDKYLWTYLSHADFWEYTRHRWPAESSKINVRYFVTNTKTSLYDNSISRLWWYGYITYDDRFSNPFELTEILLTNQTICSDFVDTKYSKNKTIGKGVLLALKELKDEIAKEKMINAFRDCNKFLNRYGAVTSLDLLKSEEIKEIVIDYMQPKYSV